jgi:hypothetical protein
MPGRRFAASGLELAGEEVKPLSRGGEEPGRNRQARLLEPRQQFRYQRSGRRLMGPYESGQGD